MSDNPESATANLPVANAEPLPVSAEGTRWTMLYRLASDPSANMDNLERLIALQERAEARAAEQAFNIAMNEAQAEIGPIAADATNPQTRSKYATYLALDRVLRPIYVKHGFSLSYDTADSPADTVKVLCYVSHSNGHSRTYKVDMPSDGKGAKGGDVMTKTHATGAAMTYGQRYLLKLIFNIAVGLDDDGNSAGSLNDSQIEAIFKAIKETNTDQERFCEVYHIASVADLPRKKYAEAMALLRRKGASSPEPEFLK